MTDSVAEVLVPNAETARLWRAEPGCDARTEFNELMRKFWKLMEGQFWIQREISSPTRQWRCLVEEALALYALPAVRAYLDARQAQYSAEFIDFLRAGGVDGKRSS